MRITDISVSENECSRILANDFGITSAIRMPHLGKVVVLAGANGAGKTRLLKVIDAFGNHYRGIDGPDVLIEKVRQQESNTRASSVRLKRYP